MIVITYPPDFDGELHIDVDPAGTHVSPTFRFSFEHAAKPGETSWAVLVRAAQAILDQESRRQK
jgi:hypothetical protein